MKIGQKARRPW